MDFFPQKIQNKLTSNLKNVMKTAEDISREFNHETIGIEHVIFGILSQKGSAGSNILSSEKLDLKSLRQLIESMPKAKKWKPNLSEQLKNVLKKSVLVATRYKHTYIGTEHLLYAILAGEEKEALEIFSFLPFGAYLFSLSATIIIANFLLKYFFTNRSVYSFLALSGFASAVYGLAVYFFISVFSLVNPSAEIADENFLFSIPKQICLNVPLAFVVYYIIYFFGRSFKPVFLVKKY